MLFRSVIACSNAVAQFVQGISPQVIPNGTEPLSSISCGSQSGRLLGTACRLAPSKGIIYLIRAVASLRTEFPDLRLEIAGSGPDQAALAQEVVRYGLADSVTFLGWQSPLAPLMATWDIFVHPSLDEGLPIAVIEAMAAGLPVVATAVGGTPELVDHGRTGWLVPPKDPEALANRLRMLLLNPERRRSMGASGRARVSESFSSDRMAAAVCRVYDNIVAPSRLSGR